MTGIHTISFDNARITLQESSKPKLYFPSTINTDYLLWHTQFNVYAKAYFDPKKYAWRQIRQFSYSYINQIFSVNAKIYSNSSFEFILSSKIWKLLSKVGLILVFIVLGIYNFAPSQPCWKVLQCNLMDLKWQDYLHGF